MRLGIPGLSVAVLEDGKLLWTQGFGFADIEGRVRATPETPYHIASVTKTFTAILVWRLANSEALADHHYKVGEDVMHDLFACAFINSFVPEVKARRGRPSDVALEGQPQPGENKDGSPAPATDCASSSRQALAKWHAERRATARKALPLAPGQAAAVAGRYQFPSRIATFAREGERLFLEWPDGMRAEVFAESPATAFVKIRAWTMTFVRERDKVTRIDILDNGEVYKAVRVD